MTLTFQGVVKHLHLLPHELEDYEEQVEKVMRRYVKRLQWLLSGSRRVFGTITEKHVSTCNFAMSQIQTERGQLLEQEVLGTDALL